MTKDNEKGANIFENCIEVKCLMCTRDVVYVYHRTIGKFSCLSCHHIVDLNEVLKTVNKMTAIAGVLDDDDNDDMSYFDMIRDSLVNHDYYLCESCDYQVNDDVNHEKCMKEILVMPNGYEDYIACKCECNESNWENEDDVTRAEAKVISY